MGRSPDTVADRWARLAPSVRAFGPDDATPRPAVLLFHGCGGIRPHIQRYAELAAARGFRAFEIDSFGPRGWSREFAQAFVCTAAVLRGWERAGDVLAAIWGVSQRPEVDADRLALAGWSHGGWGIMELMSSARGPGDLGLADPQSVDLTGVKANFLAYPYVGFLAQARHAPWEVRPRTLAINAAFDHLTTPRNHERVFERVRASGVAVETWTAHASHCFDEPAPFPPMRHHPTVTAETEARFTAFLQATL